MERTLGALLLLVALIPRALLLSRGDPFWFDEDWTEEVGLLPLPQILERLAASDFHPPLGYLLLGAWARLMHGLGIEAEVFYRLPLVLAGMGASYGLYRLLLAKGAGPWRAFLGGSALALMPEQVLQDTEFRMYALASLLQVGALAGALTGRRGFWALFAAFGLYTHYLGGALALSLGGLMGWGRHLLWPLLAFLPWAPVALHQALRVESIARYNGSPASRIQEIASLLYGHEDLLLVPGLLFWGLALFGLLREREGRILLGGTFLALALLGLLGFQPASPRYLPLLSPFLAYGAARAARGLVGTTLLLAVLLLWLALWPWMEWARLSLAWPAFAN